MKRLMVGLAAGALMAATVPGMASASDPGCPPGGNNIPKPAADGDGAGIGFDGWVPGWYLQDVSEFSGDADVGNAADKNGDGLICTKLAVGLSKKVGYTAFVAKDNKLPGE